MTKKKLKKAFFENISLKAALYIFKFVKNMKSKVYVKPLSLLKKRFIELINDLSFTKIEDT